MGSDDGELDKSLPLQWQKKIEDQWQRTVEHAKTYPYVWGSYAVVWGGLAIFTTYKWKKLRNMEDRVRSLQQKLKRLVEAEEAAKIEEAALKKQDIRQPKSSAGHDIGDVGRTGK
eukprot:Gb_20312 [translate_table: standard]